MEIRVYKDSEELAAAAADLFAEVARDAIEARGWAKIGLSGGSTPESMYRLLAQPDRATLVDWSRTMLFLADERLVPYDDPRSNFGMIQRTLLANVDIPEANVYPVPTKFEAVSAIMYELSLKSVIPDMHADLIFLGLGEDGHTASLFSGSPALTETPRRAMVTPPGVLPPHVDRVTLTLPVINASRNIAFLVSGEKKAEIFRRVMDGDKALPASTVQPTDGNLIWLVDRAAAGKG